MMEALGVSLKTSRMEMTVGEPHEPDICVGRMFDRNWELLDREIPMGLARGVVLPHFHSRVERAVEINLARLVTQRNAVLAECLGSLLAEARKRLDSLIYTMAHVLSTACGETEAIRADLAGLEQTLPAWREMPRGGAGRPAGESNRLEP